MDVQLLDEGTLADIIEYTGVRMKEQMLPKGSTAGKAFLGQALARDDFFPPNLQMAIEERRGKLSTAQYLFQHDPFFEAYNTYRSDSAEITDSVCAELD